MRPLACSVCRVLLIAAAAAAAAAGALAVPVAAVALTQTKPSAPCGATRVREYALNLDGSGANEHIFVFNLGQGGQPTTFLSVWNQRRYRVWDRSQYSRVFGPSPGSQASGLEYALAGDLNNDRRFEVAVLDFITPSVGEQLTILRQSGYHTLRFRPLQSISGDQIVRVPSAPGAPSVFAVTIKPNHSPDGQVHNERWAWSNSRHRWVCVSGPTVCVRR